MISGELHSWATTTSAPAERLVEVELRSAIATQDDPRHQDLGDRQRRTWALGERIRQAPAVDWLVDHDLVAAAQKLPRDAAQEMGVAVIPA